MKRTLKLISFLLVFSMLLTLIPTSAIANSSIEQKSDEQKENPIIAEVVDKRERYTKVYQHEDLSFTAAAYNEPIHYLKDGKYEEIDNTLVENTNEKGEIVYKNKANSVSIELPKQISSGKPITISNNGYSLSFSADEIYSSKSSIKLPVEIDSKAEINRINKLRSKDDVPKIKGKVSKVKYSNVNSNTDVEYEIRPDSVKESIILKKAPKTDVAYSYTITAPNLSAKLQDDNSIIFYNEENVEQFFLPAPFMYDNKIEQSYNIKVTLEHLGNGTYRLNIAPSIEWLTDKDRDYPVVIDPEVIVNSEGSQDWRQYYYEDDIIYMYHVTPSGETKVGYNNYYSTCRSLLKFNGLPEIGSGDFVTGAKLNTYIKSKGSNMRINVHNVSGMEYSSPIIDQSIQDSVFISETGMEYTWDITESVIGWYSGQPNNGILFKADKIVTDKNYVIISTVTDPETGAIAPSLTIRYKNFDGLNTNCDYHTQNIGRAGTVHINDVTGNLVLERHDMGYSGNIMPVSIDMYYNSSHRDDFAPGFGAGWRSSYTNRVHFPDMLFYGDPFSSYVDETGTRHYFREANEEEQIEQEEEEEEEEGKYINLSGTTIEMYDAEFSDPCPRKIIDQNGHERLVGYLSYLTQISQNDQPNTHTITIDGSGYSSTEMTITDGAGRRYRINKVGTPPTGIRFNQIDYLGSGVGTDPVVADGEDQSIIYTYSVDGDLIRVDYPDGEYVTYEWYTEPGYEHLLKKAIDIDGYTIEYKYTADSFGVRRVSEVIERPAGGSSEGNAIYIEYGRNQTIFYDKQMFGNKANYEIMQFDNNGNTISARDKEGNAVFASYGTDDESGMRNQLLSVSNPQRGNDNLIENSGFEYTTPFWTSESDYSHGVKGVVNDIPSGFRSNNAYVIDNQSTVAPAVESIMDLGTLEPGTYSISAWVKTENLSNVTNGVFIYIDDYYSATELIKTDTGWQKVEDTFTLSYPIANANLYLAVFATGTAYFDNVQLIKEKAPNRYNLIENGEFKFKDVNDQPNNWSVAESGVNDVIIEMDDPQDENLYNIHPSYTQHMLRSSYSDKNVMQLQGSFNVEKEMSQIVYLDGKEGESYTYGCWSKANALPFREDTGRTFGMRVEIPDPEAPNGRTEVDSFNFDDCVPGWQFKMSSFTLPKDCSQMEIIITFHDQADYAYFDAVQLYNEPFGYDFSFGQKDGYNGIIQEEIEQTEESEELEPIDRSKTVEDEHGRIIQSVSPGGIGSTYEYDDDGNITESSITNGRLSIHTSSLYTQNGFMQSQKDALGNTVTYDYNENLGTLDSIENNQNVIDYTYDSMQRLKGVASSFTSYFGTNNSTQTGYAYGGDRLSSITHNNEYTYNFNYDSYGALDTVGVLGEANPLISFSYNPVENGRTLDKINYANLQYTQYSYDDKNNITGVWLSGSSNGYSYQYDELGALIRKKDTVNGTFTKYKNDVVEEWNIEGTELKHSYAYSTSGDTSTLFEKIIGFADRTTTYKTDNEGRSIGTEYSSQGKDISKEIYYDDLGRVTGNTIFTGAPEAPPSTLARTNYLYRDLGDHKSTQQVYGMDISFGLDATPNNKFLFYTYDDVGNIASESENGAQKKSYQYDEIGQLTRVNDAELDRTFVYIYNANGNMTQKREYTYTTGAINAQTTALHTTDYIYSGAGLTDRLVNVKIDGVDHLISYDDSYNMTNYNGKSYAWQGGRQLASATKNGVTTEYKYNDAGIRTQKDVGGSTVNYTLIDDKVTAESGAFGPIYYRYDGNGELISIWHDWDEYFYIRNLQGDIIALVCENGNIAAKYSYDAWGNPIAITDGNDNDVSGQPYHIANINPYRYRGYRFDTETGLYYLQSRYYDPEIGRFISMDDTKILMLTQGELLGANLFAYCNNNPVNFIDRTGMWSEDVHYGTQLYGPWLPGTPEVSKWAYGTYKWALECGISKEHVSIIAKANIAQDNWNNSAFFSWYTFSRGNYKKHLRAHGAYDYANERFWDAVKLWKEAVKLTDTKKSDAKKKESLQELGRALHAMQDYYAHLDWNVDEQKAVYHKSWQWVYKNKKWQWETGNSYFDNVDYDVWRGTGVNKNFYFHKYVGRNNNPRFKLTREVTILWINCFKKETGYKS